MVTVLEITYSNNKIKKVCTDDNIATKVYGPAMARKIHQRIIELSASDTVEMMIRYHIGRCHALSHDRKDQYALDLVHPYRLIFEKKGDTVQIAFILEIVDYH